MESKTIFLSSLDVERYKKATHYKGSSWPSSFLLTLWQHFEVAELTEVAHYLVEQKIELFQPIQLEEVCQCHLVRVAVIPKKKGEIWVYRLEIEQDGLGAVCETKIYVRQSDEDI